MSKCDNWEKRAKLLEENGWIYDKLWRKFDTYVCDSTLELMSDYEFFYLIEHDKPMKADTINQPSYYTDGKIEVSDFIADKNLNFFRGNVVKYVARAGKKNAETEVEDLQKARWYIDREIERLGGK